MPGVFSFLFITATRRRVSLFSKLTHGMQGAVICVFVLPVFVSCFF
jgi:hypothetical protein